MSVIAGTLLVVGLTVFFRWAARDLHAVGDQAILEIYTLHAARGLWTLGPYSQFGWHHPGPLYFYLLAPVYLLSGHKTIALHLGAFAINLLSVSAIVYTLFRHGAAPIACAVAVALAAYLVRLEPLVSSYWNPHIVIVPATLYLVVSAAVAAGQPRALPASVIVGSFLAQTHVSLVPYVFVLGSGAWAAFWWCERRQERTESFRWVLASASVLLLVWLLPIVEQATGSPGNLTRIVQFFGDPSPGQTLRAALIVWGDLICALFRPHLDVPEGLPISIPDRAVTAATVVAAAQAVILIAASVDALRRRERFHCALAALGLAGSIVGLWSITRVKSLIGDYTIFWLSGIGTLNWAFIGGLVLTRVVGLRLRVVQQWAVLVCVLVLLWSVIDIGSSQLKRARRQGLRPGSETAKVVQLASDAILEDIGRNGVQRPLFAMQTRDWAAAAGVLLQVYKRSDAVSVDRSLVSLFGEPLGPIGQEDRLFVIADANAHAILAQEPGDELVANVEDMYIHARSVRPRR